MTDQKTKKKPAPSKKSKPAPSFKSNLWKAAVGMAILSFIVVCAGIIAHFLLSPSAVPTKESPQKSKTVSKGPKQKPLHFEIYPKEEMVTRKRDMPPPDTAGATRPKVALIIDDLGYDSRIFRKFIDLNIVMTLSVLPHSPLRKKIPDEARKRGLEVMLHLPMEPVEYPTANPGPGTLLVSMTPDELIKQLEANLQSVPFIKGVNNHMGSRMTAISTQMYQIFSILKKKDLYFIDSRTTKETLCKPSARLLQISFGERDVFLDHNLEPGAIRRQIDRLIDLAVEHGEAIGIGHPHRLTYTILREKLPDLQKRVELVPASAVTHPVGVTTASVR